MALPSEKVHELKQIIHSHVSQMNVHSRIRDCVDESFRGEEAESAGIDEAGLLNALKERGIVDDVMNTLKFEGLERDPGRSKDKRRVNALEEVPARVGVDPTRRYLYLQVLGGKAFLEHLQDPEPLPGKVTSTFTLYVHFKGQRFKSRPVPCACEPDINEGFLLELQKDGGKMADAATLLSISDYIHLVLIKTDPSGDTTLIGSHFLPWRDILSAANGRLTSAVEINGVGAEAKVPMGILEIKFEIIPRLSQILTKEVISAQVNLEHSRIAERERLFLVYAKQWWKEFLQIRASHSNRLVKIFAQDECGTNRPVCSFVCPLRAGRLLDSPRQAARFVSLLGYEHAPSVGGGRAEMWSSLHAFLCKGKGDCEDHAVLLCSLLLGFGLNAFVCVGTKGKGAAHTWVMTISPEGEVTFWESLTAHRYAHRPVNPDDPPALKQSRPDHPYRTVGCVFNHRTFYANSQPTDSVEVCQFELQNEARWKCMSEEALRSVCGPKILPSGPVFPPLYPSGVDSSLVSNDMEHELRSLVTDHRRDLGLNTAWDDELSYILTPALAAYELEYSTGVSAGNEEFQQAIRRAIPDGHTFKGFPIQFVHRNARRAFATCLRSPVCEEIICCRGDHVRLAVRVRVFTYPEGACAVWIMFAVRYRSIL
ncbi:centrosomal protein of 76 kDa-like [Pocillopora damicornis]|uniref:centrosomal protein of 76 kDa-like n=1 Tax=Pocillopora damicornis TaxID=46731 RepID=UPI000F54C68D|nr:centrosomal protein of 76 kDa-like [Pocillopora damicornis]